MSGSLISIVSRNDPVVMTPCLVADDNGTCKTPAPSPSVATEKRLMDCLMKSYNQDVRPAHNVSDVVTVHFDMTYIHIVSLVGDEHYQLPTNLTSAIVM